MHQKTLKTIEKNCQILLDSSCQNFESVFLCSPLRLPYLICALVKKKPGISSTEIIKTLDIGANSFRQIARILVEKNVLRSAPNGVTKHYYFSEEPINAYLLKIQNQIIYENKSLQEAGNKFDSCGKKTAFLKRNKTSVSAIKAIRNKMIVTDYKKGEKIDYICQKYSFSSLSLRRILLENNIKITNKSNPKYLCIDLEKIKSICLDINTGMTMKAIGEKYNMHTTILYRHLYKFGITKNDLKHIKTYLHKSEVVSLIDSLILSKSAEKDIETLDFDEIKSKIIYQNMTINSLVSKNNSYSEIYKFLKDNNTTITELKKERVNLIFADYKLGISYEDILKKYSISLSVFSRILLERGINRKEQREKELLRNNPEKIKLICLDINKGKTLNQITSKYKLSNPVIYNHLHKFGLSKQDIKNIRCNLSASEVVDLCDRVNIFKRSE